MDSTRLYGLTTNCKTYIQKELFIHDFIYFLLGKTPTYRELFAIL